MFSRPLMRSFSWTLLVLWAAALGSLCAEAEELNIDEVAVEGNQRVEVAAIRQQLKAVSGRVTTDEIDQDVKNLYQTGFFDQVAVSVVRSETPARKTLLRYTVLEKPLVRKVFVRGNKHIDESELAPLLSFESSRFLDRAKVELLIKRAAALYHSRGYNDAAIDYSIVPVGENQVDVTFSVTEGERYKIKDIRIVGLKTISEDDLLSVMESRRYKWWNSWLFGTGRLNREMLENDRILIRQYLLDHGLIDGTVSEPLIQTVAKGFIVTFEVNEGRRYTVGRIGATGDLVEGGEEETLRGIKSKPGDVFSASLVREDAFKISDKFSDAGYAFANVIPDTSVDAVSGRVNLDFRIQKGNLVTVRRINIHGNNKTYDHVIRRELKIDEQDVYSGKKVRRSQQLLKRLGYFEEVNISNEPVGADKLDLNVNVREGSTGAFSAGAGYSTSDGFLFNIRISENNLLGTGRRAIVNFDVGTKRDSFVLSFEDPRLNDSHVFGGLDLARYDRIYEDFDKRLAGPGLNFAYPLEEVFGESFEDISAGLKYDWVWAKIHNVDREAARLVKDSQGSTTASGVTPRLVRNTINNPLNPSKGSRQEIRAELTGLGAEERFYLIEAHHTLYYPLFESSYGNIVLSWRFNVGYGEPYDGGPLPLYKRYFPGGINSVRGYKERSLGPKDAAGREYGGDKQLVNNLDLIFPLFHAAGVNGVVFYDAGQAFDDQESVELSELRQGYGFGLRWSSPIGPMRIEFGFPVGRKEGEDAMVTMFSFGAPL